MNRNNPALKLLPGLLLAALPVLAGSFSVDLTIHGGTSGFASPIVTFTNQSDSGYQITQTDLAGAFSDHVLNRTGALIAAPAGGTYTAIAGTQVSSGNPNDGCDPQTFSLTGFDTGEFFSYIFDPENNSCSNVVFDFRSRLDNDAVTATVKFAGPGITGTTTLTGHTWAKELINPSLASSPTNDLYRLTLSGSAATEPEPTPTPEPTTLLLLGSALFATTFRKRFR